MALYHRMRPTTFTEVVGQEALVSGLGKRVKADKLPHVLLFHGPSGTGKTTLARVCASELGCTDWHLTEINCAEVRGIDSVREIQEGLPPLPMSGRCKVYILDEVVQLPKTTQQAFLKVLEDVPKHVYFFLCTTSTEGLLPTFLSRCEIQTLGSLDNSNMNGILQRACASEKWEPEGVVLKAVIDHAQGNARVALNTLERVMALPKEVRLAAVGKSADEEASELLARLLFQRASWDRVYACASRVADKDVEGTRRQVLAYAGKVMVDRQKVKLAYHVILCFERPFFDGGKASLLRACWEAVQGAG